METTKKTIIERVKSFEDACNLLGEDPKEILPYKEATTKRQHAINDLTMLDVIAESLQENWIADWDNHNQPKWRPYFEKGSWGFGFSVALYGCRVTFASVGSRLSFPTEEIAKYFGTQFIEIHNRLLSNKY